MSPKSIKSSAEPLTFSITDKTGFNVIASLVIDRIVIIFFLVVFVMTHIHFSSPSDAIHMLLDNLLIISDDLILGDHPIVRYTLMIAD
jgi:hypothetical protein